MATPIESIEILLIEDNMDDVQLVTMALEENNIVNHVTHLKDGAEAIDFLFHEGGFADKPADNKPKIIMLDINMPKINGMEFLRRIKSDEKTKDIPVVVFTSSNEDPHLKESYRLGVNKFIVKPLDFEEFKVAINKSITGLLKYTSQFRSM
jgi:two-component system response regulator